MTISIPTKEEILSALEERPMSIDELAEHFKIPTPPIYEEGDRKTLKPGAGADWWKFNENVEKMVSTTFSLRAAIITEGKTKRTYYLPSQNLAKALEQLEGKGFRDVELLPQNWYRSGWKERNCQTLYFQQFLI